METSPVLLENEIVPALNSNEYSLNPGRINNLKLSELRTILKYNKKKLHAFAQRYSVRSTNLLSKKICNKIDITCFKKNNIKEANNFLINEVKPDQIIISGSLYLVGKIRKLYV